MTRHLLSRVVGVGLLALALAPCEAGAQDQPVVFLHGWNSDPDTWREAAERLRTRLAIEPHRFPTSWLNTIGDQANELQAQYPASAVPPVTVGHSNGGLIARHWSRQRNVHGIVTIGTPHSGAPLLRNRVALARYYQQGYARVHAAAFALAPQFDEWDWVGAPATAAANQAGRLTYSGLWGLAITTGFDRLFPIHRDMAPGSSFLTELNSDANLTHERLNVPHRVGIVSIHPRSTWGGPLRLAGHAAGDTSHVVIVAIAVSLDFWALRIVGSADPTDPVAYLRAVQRASTLANLARWTWDFESEWCSAITSTTSRRECEPSDVVLPFSRQLYPGASRILLTAGPVHTDETTDSDEALLRALEGELAIPVRTGGR